MKTLASVGLVALFVGAIFGTDGFAAPARAKVQPSIHLLRPTGPVTVSANGQIPIALQIAGITLDERNMGRAHILGHGHFHFYVDCIPSDAYTKADLKTCWAGAAARANTVFNLATSKVNISGGTHTLLMALSRNDHVLYQAAPVSLVFTVVEPHMSIRVLSPTQAVTVGQNAQLAVRVRINGMTIDMNGMGRQNIPGHGHFHFYVDCVPHDAYEKADLKACWAGADAKQTTVFDLAKSRIKVTKGTHLLIVALAQNDHILYRAPAASIVFTVSGH